MFTKKGGEKGKAIKFPKKTGNLQKIFLTP